MVYDPLPLIDINPGENAHPRPVSVLEGTDVSAGAVQLHARVEGAQVCGGRGMDEGGSGAGGIRGGADTVAEGGMADENSRHGLAVREVVWGTVGKGGSGSDSGVFMCILMNYAKGVGVSVSVSVSVCVLLHFFLDN